MTIYDTATSKSPLLTLTPLYLEMNMYLCQYVEKSTS